MPTALRHHFPVFIGLVLLGGGRVEAQNSSSSQLRAEMARISETLESLPHWVSDEQRHGQLGFHGTPSEAQWIIIDLGSKISVDEVVLFPARVPVGSGEAGTGGFPPEIEVEISDRESFENPIRIGRWQEPEEGAGTRLPMLRFPVQEGREISGRYLRLRIFGSRPRSSIRGRFYTLGEIVARANGCNVALRRPVTTSGGIENPPRWRAANLTDGYLWCLPARGSRPSPSNGFHSGIEDEAQHSKWVEVDFGEPHAVDEVHLVPSHPQDFADTVGFGFPPRFRVVGIGEGDEERVLFETGVDSFPNPGASSLMLPAGSDLLQRVRIECPELWQRTGDYLFALAELQAWSGGRNVAEGKPVQASDVVETGIWAAEALTDGFSSRRDLLDWQVWLDGLGERAELEAIRVEIVAILNQRAALARRRWLLGAMVGVAGILAALVLALFLQRKQAARSREELRERIAHDLHDELGASLSHLALQSDLARRRLAVDDPVRERLEGLSSSARTTLDNMRDVIWLLAPATDSWRGFRERIESIAGRLLDGVDHEIRSEGDPPAGSPSIEWAREWVLFFKEAVTNARRHAEARMISIVLEWQPHSLHLLIRDDGRGFVPEDPTTSDGLGLKSLSRRAAALGGRLDIESQPGAGTTVRLEAPLPDKKRT